LWEPDGVSPSLSVPTETVNNLVAAIQREMALYGYQLIETPIIAPADLFLTRAGDQIINKLFTFERHGQQLALRPEFTAEAAYRYTQQDTAIVRWQFTGSVFEDNSQNFLRDYQRLSIGAELIGMSGPAADAEIMSLAAYGLIKQDLQRWTLVIGHTGLMRHLLARFQLDTRTERFLLSRINMLHEQGKLVVLEAFDRALLDGSTPHLPAANADAHLSEIAEVSTHDMLGILLDVSQRSMTMGGRTQQDIARRLLQKRRRLAERQQVIDALDFLEMWGQISAPPDQAFGSIASMIDPDDTLASKLLDDWRNAVQLLIAYGIDLDQVVIRPHLSRNWDYYTGIVFELHADNGVHLGGGGRYDELITLVGGEGATPAVGFAYYVDQVLSCIPNSSTAHPEPIIILVNQGNQEIAAALAHTLRLHEIPVSLFPHETTRSGRTCILIDKHGDIHAGGVRYTPEEIDALIADLQRVYHD
jgi:histidyl-tRNA synthetase